MSKGDDVLSSAEVVVVTGAGTGIGRGIASRFAGDGMRVVVADVNVEAGHDACCQIKRDGGECHFVAADVSSREDCDRLVQTTVKKAGRLDVLVNNAGVSKPLDFFDVTASDWDWIMAVNARGTFMCMQAAARAMKEAGGGRIVNISSISGKGWGGASNIAYAASKAAVIAMTRLAAQELGPHGITVNAVCPGVTETPLLRAILSGRDATTTTATDRISLRDSTLEGMLARIPIGRINKVEDIAAAVAFLASPGAGTINGQSLNVDGGKVFD